MAMHKLYIFVNQGHVSVFVITFLERGVTEVLQLIYNVEEKTPELLSQEFWSLANDLFL